MKIITWNINSVKTSTDKTTDLFDLIIEHKPDLLLFNETKINSDKIEFFKSKFPDFDYQFWNSSSAKKGYSGTALLSKINPILTFYDFKHFIDIDPDDLDVLNLMVNEGRLIISEFTDFFLICAYVPNSGVGLKRLIDRINIWEVYMRKLINKLQERKPVIYTGDLNVAHNEIDLARPDSNKHTAGFTKEERNAFALLLDKCSLIDTYRTLYPKKIEYTFFSAMSHAREKNIGWRIDYFLVSKSFFHKIKDSSILGKFKGSDHVPILLEL